MGPGARSGKEALEGTVLLNLQGVGGRTKGTTMAASSTTSKTLSLRGPCAAPTGKWHPQPLSSVRGRPGTYGMCSWVPGGQTLEDLGARVRGAHSLRQHLNSLYFFMPSTNIQAS